MSALGSTCPWTCHWIPRRAPGTADVPSPVVPSEVNSGAIRFAKVPSGRIAISAGG